MPVGGVCALGPNHGDMDLLVRPELVEGRFLARETPLAACDELSWALDTLTANGRAASRMRHRKSGPASLVSVSVLW